MAQTFIHPTAEVSPEASIGKSSYIWHQAQVREHARIGEHCIISKGVYIDTGVSIGDNVKIQNGCFVYHGVTLEDGVFLGPGVILTNDKIPRAINPDGSPKSDADWEVGKILVMKGASLGAGVTVVTNVVIGAFAMVGAGSVVTRNIPDHALAIGCPARLIGFVCYCGARLQEGKRTGAAMEASCVRCGRTVSIPLEQWQQVK